MNNPTEEQFSRSRSRSRDREDYERVARLTGRAEDEQQQQREQRDEREGQREHEEDDDNFNIYVTNLSYETNNERLREAFERIGPVKDAQVVIEPIQRVSRGFGFVNMTNAQDSARALELNGMQLDGRTIRVEKARRKAAYEKTPGTYMGPSSLSNRFGSRNDRNDRNDRPRDRERDRSRDRGDRPYPRDVDFRDRDRDRERGRERDRERGDFVRDRERDFREPMHDRMRGPPPYDPRYRDFRDEPPPRYADFRRDEPLPVNYDPRDVRSLGPPPGYIPYDRRSRSPPARGYRPARSPPRDYRPLRSPPRGMDDRRMPPPDRQGPPPGYGRGPRY